jgi:argininosuccinate lyase
MTAHAMVGAVARELDVRAAARVTEALRLEGQRVGYDLDLSEAEVTRALSLDHFVAVRTTPGGPAPEVTAAALVEAGARLDADAAALAHAREALRAADAQRWGGQPLVP